MQTTKYGIKNNKCLVIIFIRSNLLVEVIVRRNCNTNLLLKAVLKSSRSYCGNFDLFQVREIQ